MLSAMGQDAEVDGRSFVDMLRTDAAISRNGDGGPVVDRDGRVIAITTTNVARGDGRRGMGLATPIDVARSVAADLMEFGRVRSSWIGIEGRTRDDGVVVKNVFPESPAAAVGLIEGDVIVGFDNLPSATMSAMVARLRSLEPGTATDLVVERAGSRTIITLTLGERPA